MNFTSAEAALDEITEKASHRGKGKYRIIALKTLEGWEAEFAQLLHQAKALCKRNRKLSRYLAKLKSEET